MISAIHFYRRSQLPFFSPDVRSSSVELYPASPSSDANITGFESVLETSTIETTPAAPAIINQSNDFSKCINNDWGYSFEVPTKIYTTSTDTFIPCSLFSFSEITLSSNFKFPDDWLKQDKSITVYLENDSKENLITKYSEMIDGGVTEALLTSKGYNATLFYGTFNIKGNPHDGSSVYIIFIPKDTTNTLTFYLIGQVTEEEKMLFKSLAQTVELF